MLKGETIRRPGIEGDAPLRIRHEQIGRTVTRRIGQGRGAGGLHRRIEGEGLVHEGECIVRKDTEARGLIPHGETRQPGLDNLARGEVAPTHDTAVVAEPHRWPLLSLATDHHRPREPCQCVF